MAGLRSNVQWIDGPVHPAYIGQTVWTYSGISPGSRQDTYRDFGFGPDLDSIRIYPGEPGYNPPPNPPAGEAPQLPPPDVFAPPPPPPPPVDVPTQIQLPPGVVTPAPTAPPIIGPAPVSPPVVSTPPINPTLPPRTTPTGNATSIGVDWLYGKRDEFKRRKSRIEEQLEAKRRYDERSRARAAKQKAEYEARKRVIDGTVLRRAARAGSIVGAILEVLWPTDLGDATLPTSRRNVPDFPPPGNLPPFVLDTTLPPLPPLPRAPRRARTSRPPELPPSSVPAPVLDTALPDLGETTSQRSPSRSPSGSTARAPSSTLPGMDWGALLFPFATLLPRFPTRAPGRTFFSPPSVTTPAPSPTMPLPFAPPSASTPTFSSPTPVASSPPSWFTPTGSPTPTADPRCRCPKPKKRKKGCTNKLISTTRRDGIITTKRKQTCPPSRPKPASRRVPRIPTSSAARRSNTAVAGIFSAWG